ncbi:serine/threonine protein kinase, putative [Plasmodium malariae]|uniref:Serine/threonine protein kinase, putative n=1 Tax=Plasmodium malariae TaxID=5858 RepID=A0A1D3JMS2_PLAMA|nr:serine/threonine protein kinase, putative [Plasmodium malariae]SBT87941.1 serine/threonine protein kinase, putative [Plasmodium malariae]
MSVYLKRKFFKKHRGSSSYFSDFSFDSYKKGNNSSENINCLSDSEHILCVRRPGRRRIRHIAAPFEMVEREDGYNFLNGSGKTKACVYGKSQKRKKKKRKKKVRNEAKRREYNWGNNLFNKRYMKGKIFTIFSYDYIEVLKRVRIMKRNNMINSDRVRSEEKVLNRQGSRTKKRKRNSAQCNNMDSVVSVVNLDNQDDVHIEEKEKLDIWRKIEAEEISLCSPLLMNVQSEYTLCSKKYKKISIVYVKEYSERKNKYILKRKIKKIYKCPKETVFNPFFNSYIRFENVIKLEKELTQHLVHQNIISLESYYYYENQIVTLYKFGGVSLMKWNKQKRVFQLEDMLIKTCVINTRNRKELGFVRNDILTSMHTDCFNTTEGNEERKEEWNEEEKDEWSEEKKNEWKEEKKDEWKEEKKDEWKEEKNDEYKNDRKYLPSVNCEEECTGNTANTPKVKGVNLHSNKTYYLDRGVKEVVADEGTDTEDKLEGLNKWRDEWPIVRRDKRRKKGKRMHVYPEYLIAEILRQLLKVCLFLYEHRIYHSDIKPSNIVVKNVKKENLNTICYSNKKNKWSIKKFGKIMNRNFLIKLIDFEYSQKVYNEKANIGGTTSLFKPLEDFKKNKINVCSKLVWIIGITLFILSTGTHPFCNVNNDVHIFFIIKSKKFNIRKRFKRYSYFSDSFKDLLERMLRVQVNKRISFFDIFIHPFVLFG